MVSARTTSPAGSRAWLRLPHVSACCPLACLPALPSTRTLLPSEPRCDPCAISLPLPWPCPHACLLLPTGPACQPAHCRSHRGAPPGRQRRRHPPRRQQALHGRPHGYQPQGSVEHRCDQHYHPGARGPAGHAAPEPRPRLPHRLLQAHEAGGRLRRAPGAHPRLCVRLRGCAPPAALHRLPACCVRPCGKGLADALGYMASAYCCTARAYCWSSGAGSFTSPPPPAPHPAAVQPSPSSSSAPS